MREGSLVFAHGDLQQGHWNAAVRISTRRGEAIIVLPIESPKSGGTDLCALAEHAIHELGLTDVHVRSKTYPISPESSSQ